MEVTSAKPPVRCGVVTAVRNNALHTVKRIGREGLVGSQQQDWEVEELATWSYWLTLCVFV